MTNQKSIMFSPLTLPNGVVINNRLCKASMEENLCDQGQIPGQRLITLYQTWASGGSGLILTGNVMVSPDALTGPGGVVLDSDQHLDRFKRWAQAGRSGGAQFWMQINHPGRQVYAAMGEKAVAPSKVPVNIPGFSNLFAKPEPLTDSEIEAIIERFANTAALAQQAGFDGVEIHAAHGYLISQFLSPITNLRTDKWGGHLENRARILFEIVQRVRARVDPRFCVAVKLNSADFQKGGFSAEDAAWVVSKLNDLAIDLVELSGGSYESPAMQGRQADNDVNSSTQQREAYFVDFARDIAKVANMPIMVTGGIRRKAVAEQALSANDNGIGVNMLGVARALAFEPNLVNLWKNDQCLSLQLPEIEWKNKTFAALAVMAITKTQLARLAQGKAPKPNANPLLSLIADRMKTKFRTRRYKRWRARTT